MSEIKGMNSNCFRLDETTIRKYFSTRSTRFSKLWSKVFPEELLLKAVDYNQDLHCAGIKIPKIKSLILEEESIRLDQEFVPGTNLALHLGVLGHNQAIDLFKKVIDMPKMAFLYKNSLRIDINVDNFIVNGADLILVDIIPPLYVGIVDYPEDYIDQCYYQLCFSLHDQVYEIIYGFLKRWGIHKHELKDLRAFFDDLLNTSDEVWCPESPLRALIRDEDEQSYTPENRTLARLKVVNKFCEGRITIYEYKKLIRKFSFTAFFQDQDQKCK